MLGLMEAAELLRSVRRRRGLTQAALAQAAGTSQPVISAYEAGRRDPTVSTLRRLVAAGGEVLELSARPAPSDLPPPVDLADHARRLLDVLSLADAVPSRRRAARLDAPRLVSR
jgi:transcriptional regulator with XRE-family HTH domain